MDRAVVAAEAVLGVGRFVLAGGWKPGEKSSDRTTPGGSIMLITVWAGAALPSAPPACSCVASASAASLYMVAGAAPS
jgi:hypothetical protein